MGIRKIKDWFKGWFHAKKYNVAARLKAGAEITNLEAEIPPSRMILIIATVDFGIRCLRLADYIPPNSKISIAIHGLSFFAICFYVSQGLYNGRTKLNDQNERISDLEQAFGTAYIHIPERRHRTMGFEGDEKRVHA